LGQGVKTMKENEKINYDWRWCLVGNIVDKRFYGEEHEIKSGIKLLSPGTKVYIAPHQWGDGGDKLVVLGVIFISFVLKGLVINLFFSVSSFSISSFSISSSISFVSSIFIFSPIFIF